jgi:RNA polymerase-binding transcription factor DksA
MTMSDDAGSGHEAQTDDQPGSDDGPDALLLDQVRSDLDEVDAALRRLDQGGYGRCRQCGDLIDDRLLASAPAVAFCDAHRPGGPVGGGAPAIQG